MSGSEVAAAWVGAIGTVGAFGTGMWVLARDVKDRARAYDIERRTQARLVGVDETITGSSTAFQGQHVDVLKRLTITNGSDEAIHDVIAALRIIPATAALDGETPRVTREFSIMAPNKSAIVDLSARLRWSDETQGAPDIQFLWLVEFTDVNQVRWSITQDYRLVEEIGPSRWDRFRISFRYRRNFWKARLVRKHL